MKIRRVVKTSAQSTPTPVITSLMPMTNSEDRLTSKDQASAYALQGSLAKAIFCLAGVLLLCLIVYSWSHQWVYSHEGMVRTNRFTSQSQILRDGVWQGWRRSSALITPDQAQKVVNTPVTNPDLSLSNMSDAELTASINKEQLKVQRLYDSLKKKGVWKDPRYAQLGHEVRALGVVDTTEGGSK